MMRGNDRHAWPLGVMSAGLLAPTATAAAVHLLRYEAADACLVWGPCNLDTQLSDGVATLAGVVFVLAGLLAMLSILRSSFGMVALVGATLLTVGASTLMLLSWQLWALVPLILVLAILARPKAVLPHYRKMRRA